jgi:hypothetical protein
VREDGKVGYADKATTLDAARARAGRLKAALESCVVHAEVLNYCLGAHPASENPRGIPALLVDLTQAILQHHKGRPRCEDIDLAVASNAVARLRCLYLDLGLLDLSQHEVAHLLRVVALDPGEGGVALDTGDAHLLFGAGAVGFPLEAFGPQARGSS